MKVVDFPVLAPERWTLARDLDTLRFDILSARSVADRLRKRDAAQLAEMTSRENLQNTIAQMDSILEFFAELNAAMTKEDAKPRRRGTRNASGKSTVKRGSKKDVVTTVRVGPGKTL